MHNQKKNMAERPSPISYGKKARKLSGDDGPIPKRVKQINTPVYPVDIIKTEDDIKSIEREMEALENTSGSINCGNCGRNLTVKVIHGKSPNIIHHFIFGEASPTNHRHQILKLMCCEQGAGENHVAAVRVCGRWWTVEEMLTSNDLGRNGLRSVCTFGERLVLSMLNRVVMRYQEHSPGDPVFLSHPPNEMAKIMWISGKAVGFYTIKQKFKLIHDYYPDVWDMNVLDTIFVRTNYRHQGIATQMLEDFLASFPEQDVGLSYPLEDSLREVFFKLLTRRKEDRARVWECTMPSSCHSKVNLWLSLIHKKKSSRARLSA